MNQIEKLTYTVDEIGESLGISRVKAYELVKQEGFPSLRLGKRIVIPKEAFTKWLNNSANQTLGA